MKTIVLSIDNEFSIGDIKMMVMGLIERFIISNIENVDDIKDGDIFGFEIVVNGLVSSSGNPDDSLVDKDLLAKCKFHGFKIINLVSSIRKVGFKTVFDFCIVDGNSKNRYVSITATHKKGPQHNIYISIKKRTNIYICLI
jgi:hypothetical protein